MKIVLYSNITNAPRIHILTKITEFLVNRYYTMIQVHSIIYGTLNYPRVCVDQGSVLK